LPPWNNLIDKGENCLSPEESALLETMAILIQAYDGRHHPLPPVAPNEMLAYLRPAANIGYARPVSEILSGKRSISKEQAKKLASLFNVTTDLFT
jgi:HTH-type transcriptional regulator/antitoxin HigA